jgi:hypothetical protein
MSTHLGLTTAQLVHIHCSGTVFTYLLLCSVTYLPIHFQRYFWEPKFPDHFFTFCLKVNISTNLIALVCLHNCRLVYPFNCLEVFLNCNHFN